MSGGRWLVPLSCLALAPLAATLALALGREPARAASPLVTRDKGYVGAAACRACHPDHFSSWRRTYHATMTQLPSAATVRGHFDGTPVTLAGATATPLARDGRFYFRLPAFGGEGPREAEVALAVGSRRYQQYFERIADGAGGTYRRLPLLWHIDEGRWLHLNGVFLEPDSDDWGQHQAVWNMNCIFCHNTGIAPGLAGVGPDAPGGGSPRFDSHVADLGIACEACHGPGGAHAERQRAPWVRYRAALGLGLGDGAAGVVDPPRLGQAQSAAMCGQCHAQRLPDPPEKLWTFLDGGPTFRPGGVLAGHVTPLTRDTPVPDPQAPADTFRQRFWSDGTARLTAYEYLGLTQSPCFRGGRFTCASCHTMHGGDVRGQIEPAMRGDRACTQCHAELARDVAAHTHHPPSSSGSRCLECHMPRAVYGVLDIHRSHRVESPDVRRDVEAGRPSACSGCHADRSATWAAERMRAFWGDRYAAPAARPDGAPLDAPEALASLHAGDAVARAVYFGELGRDDSAVPPGARGFLLAHALVGLGDAFGAVRFLARRSALAIDRAMGLGLGDELRAFDVQAPRAARDPALLALLDHLQAAASAHRLPPPPAGTLLGDDYRLDRARLSALLGLQAGRVISVGE